MAKIEIPRVEELDFSGIKGNEKLVRYGAWELLGGFQWIVPKDREAVIREALADRSAMVAKLQEVLGPKARRIVYDTDYDLPTVSREIVDIVLNAFEKKL
jgi:hypothetical protein